MPILTPEVRSDSLTFAHITSTLRAAGCVFAEIEAQLLLSEASSPAELCEWVDRRVTGIPLEYILGWAEFYGLRIMVDPGVFVPRRRTELLVGEAVALLTESFEAGQTPGAVVDLCSGSGAVGAAVGSQLPGIELHATEIDRVAVNCARRNLTAVRGQVHQGDLYSPLPARLQGQVQLLAVNAPYVPTAALQTMPPEARIHEPRVSLDGGTDGLDLHRRVIAGAREWLATDGHVVLETSERQAAGTAAIMTAAGLATRVVRSEELDGTVVIGSKRMPGPASP